VEWYVFFIKKALLLNYLIFLCHLTESRNHSHDLPERPHLHDVLELLVHVADRELAVLDLVDQLLVVVCRNNSWKILSKFDFLKYRPWPNLKKPVKN
jgi:hypothetical protein